MSGRIYSAVSSLGAQIISEAIMTEFFHNAILPAHFSQDMRWRTENRTEITKSGSGYEFRNNVWAAPRRIYHLKSNIYPIGQMRELHEFFNARHGRLYGFACMDRVDFSSNTSHNTTQITIFDQTLVPLDDTRRVFGLRKIYSDGSIRDITKPNAQSINIARDRRTLRRYRDYQVDVWRGRIIFPEPQGEDVQLTVGFYFFIPVRFDMDTLSMQEISRTHVRIDEIRLVELPLTHDDYNQA